MPSARIERVLLFRLARSDGFERLVRRLPGAEARAWGAARGYVAGVDQASALELAGELAGRGVGASLDFFGEQVRDPERARSAADDYVVLAGKLADVAPSVWLSIDLSHIGLDVGVDFCRSQLERIVQALPSGRLIQVGAEDSARTDRILEVVLPLAEAGAPIGATLQANLRRSEADLERVAAAGLHVRLVKGAYVEPAHLAYRYGRRRTSPTSDWLTGLRRQGCASRSRRMTGRSGRLFSARYPMRNASCCSGCEKRMPRS